MPRDTKYTIYYEKDRILPKLRHFPKDVREKIIQTIDKELSSLSFLTRNVIKMKHASNRYRLRIGDYRVIFSKNEKLKQITIHQISDRKEAYDK